MGTWSSRASRRLSRSSSAFSASVNSRPINKRPPRALTTLDERLRDKLKRHGPETPNAQANPERDDYIRAAARRVADRLAAVGQRDTELERAGEQPGDHP